MIMGERVSHRLDFSQIEINIEKHLHIYIYLQYIYYYTHISPRYTNILLFLFQPFITIPSKLQRTIYFDSQK